MSPFLSYRSQTLLLSRNSAGRTNSFASAAIDAGITYNVFRVAFFDSANGASTSTSTAFYAFVRNYMHGFHLQLTILYPGDCSLFFLIITRIPKKVNDYRFSANIGIYWLFRGTLKIFSKKRKNRRGEPVLSGIKIPSGEDNTLTRAEV